MLITRGFSYCGFFASLLHGDVGGSGVDELRRVLGRGPRQRTVDPEPVAENTRGDHLHLWNLDEHLVVRGLSVHDLVVDLLLGLALGPLLLLTLRRVHGGLGLLLLRLLLLWWHLYSIVASAPTALTCVSH